MSEDLRVVDLGAVDEDVGVDVRRRSDVRLTHEGSDLSPSLALPVQERDSSVTQIVRVKVGDTGSSTGSTNRRPERV